MEFWGEFPARLIEEVLLEEDLGPAIRAGRKKAAGSFPEIRQEINEIKKNIDAKYKPAFAQLYGLCQALILRTDPTRLHAFNYLVKSHTLKRMPPKMGFALAVQTIRANFPEGFKKIALGIKKGNPLHPDIILYQDNRGETLGHMATKADRQEIIQYIACMNREFLDIPDRSGNTLCHTASKYCAMDTIHYLLGLSKRLFGKRNHNGKTALDLEAGEHICRTIAVKSVHEDLALGEARKRAALEKLTLAKNLPPSKPILQIKKPYLRTEMVSLQDPAP